jgi:hypothetical protein
MLPYGLHVVRGRNKLYNVTTRMEEQTATAVCSQCTHRWIKMSTFIITHKKQFIIAHKSDHPTFSVILTQALVLSCNTIDIIGSDDNLFT